MSDLFGPRVLRADPDRHGQRDGALEAELAKRLGATVLAEDPNTAVMPGMPAAAIDAGVVDSVLSLEELPVAIQRFADACRPRLEPLLP